MTEIDRIKHAVITLVHETASRSTISETDNAAAIATIVQRDLRRHIADAIRLHDFKDV